VEYYFRIIRGPIPQANSETDLERPSRRALSMRVRVAGPSFFFSPDFRHQTQL